MSFKLSRHDTISACDNPAEIEIVDPKTKVPTGEFISLIGKDSKEFRDYTRDKTNTRLRKDAMAQKRGKDPEIRTVEGIEAENIELLVTCTKGWRGFIDDDGNEIPFNVQNAIFMYKNFPDIYDSVNSAIGDLDNFMKA